MGDFDKELKRRLTKIRAQDLYRVLRRIDSPQGSRIQLTGRACLNFCSNDYLGLADDPITREAAIETVKRWGTGSGASRLVCGSLAPHHQLEETIAEFKGTEAAISFSSGYAAAIGTICALMGKEDVVILDKLVHASVVDAARLGGARLRIFAHNDLNDLEKILKQETRKVQSPGKQAALAGGRLVIVTESVSSMEGDCAPLKEIVELKERFGAWLMVDEAHATGLYGPNRRGLIEQCGVSGRVEVQMGTLGKALGSAGGFVCGSRALVDYLANRARTFIFSTAPVPASAAAAIAAIGFVASDAGKARCQLLWDRVSEMARKLDIQDPPSAILPLVLGEESRALSAAEHLREQGIFVAAIRYPTVARGQARLRVTLTAKHTANDVETAGNALGSLLLETCPSSPLVCPKP
jgi:8-amino-7-oxononanoate synthase